MVEDALARLRNRARPSVPPRDSSLLGGPHIPLPADTAETPPDGSLQHSAGQAHPAGSRAYDERQAEETNTLNDVNHSWRQDSFSSLQTDATPAVIRSTVRLDAKLDAQLERFCREHKITRELFLEAAFALAQTQPQWLENIATEAARRRKARLQSAERKKLNTLKAKLESD